jgi:ABC-type nitrate/sulfonate/bicarbonate transport system substrate-binding protein
MLALLAVLAGCGDPVQPQPPLRIGVMEWTGFYPVMRADVEHSFTQAGVEAQVISFPDNPSLYRAFNAGDIDVSAMVWTDAIRLSINSVPLTVVAVTDWSDPGDVILAAPGITKPEQLIGKRIACEGVHSFSHLFVLAFLDKHHIPESSVTLVDLLGGDVPAALQAGKIDAGHTWGPLIPDALTHGCTPLDYAGSLPGAITEILVVHNTVLQARKEEVRRVLGAIYAAQPRDDAGRLAALNAASRILGKPAAQLNPIGTEAHLISAPEARRLMTDVADPTGLHSSGQRILDDFAHRGQLPRDFKLGTLIDASLLPVP